MKRLILLAAIALSLLGLTGCVVTPAYRYSGGSDGYYYGQSPYAGQTVIYGSTGGWYYDDPWYSPYWGPRVSGRVYYSHGGRHYDRYDRHHDGQYRHREYRHDGREHARGNDPHHGRDNSLGARGHQLLQRQQRQQARPQVQRKNPVSRKRHDSRR